MKFGPLDQYKPVPSEAGLAELAVNIRFSRNLGIPNFPLPPGFCFTFPLMNR
jgi:hypothetical protein